MIKKWKKISTKKLADYKIFSLWQNICASPRNGKQFPFFVLNTNDWINVIPTTNDGKVIMIKQFRHGTEEITLEIPGGMIDDNDTSPIAAAQRELLEETGYASEDWVELGICSPNPAILNNKLHIFYAKNVKRVDKQKQDGAEDIEIIEVEIERIPELIKSGKINHALVIAAFHLFTESENFNLFKTKKITYKK